MSEESVQTPPQTRRKCANCGLVNATKDEACRRCGTSFGKEDSAPPIHSEIESQTEPKRRGFLRRVAWVIGATIVLLIIWYVSLLISSDGLQPDQRAKVDSAIAIVEQQGFRREAFALKRLAAFRATDNWLNAYFGHRDAYAATNFPFEVVTLYQDFFDLPIDDRERAAVLLHEARHLLGDDEDAALIFTWQNKKRLGWTADKYGDSRVWDATERWTRDRFPYLFQCGSNNQSDCY
jgi:hypothetical protein